MQVSRIAHAMTDRRRVPVRPSDAIGHADEHAIGRAIGQAIGQAIGHAIWRASGTWRVGCAVAAVLWIGGLGCSPLSATAPFHFAETAETLGRTQTSVTLGGGGGVMARGGWGAGAALRVRTGIAERQELGIEAVLLGVEVGRIGDNERLSFSGQSAFSAKLAYKGAPRDWLALVAGAGLATASTGDTVGGDVAAIFSSGRAIGGVFRPFGGLRLAVAVPVFSTRDAGGLTIGTVAAGGASFAIGPALRVTVEGGYLGAWSNPRPHERDLHTGFYFGASLGYVFGGAPAAPSAPAPTTTGTPSPIGG